MVQFIVVPALLALGGCGGDLIPVGTHWIAWLAGYCCAALALIAIAARHAWHDAEARAAARCGRYR